MNDVTRILSAIEKGDPNAATQLLPLIYDELRKLPMNSHHLYSGMTGQNRFVRGFRRQRSANLPPGPQHLERMQAESVSQRCAWP